MLIHALLAVALASSSVPSPAVVTHPSPDSIARKKRTTFGVAIAPVSDAFRRIGYLEPNEGVMLVQVQPSGAAAAANLIAGDMVLAEGNSFLSLCQMSLHHCPIHAAL